MAEEERDDIAAALLAKAEELKASPGANVDTAIGAIRKYLPAIEALLKAPGSTYGTVLSVLKSKGIEMSEKTFATNLTKVRQEQPDYVPRRTVSTPRSPGRPARPSAGASNDAPPKQTTPAKPATPPSVESPASDAPVQPKKRNLNREL